MARQYWRPSNMLYPVPAVMISCADEEGRSNIMTAAWTGTICSDPVMVSVSIRPERYSHDMIARTKEFVINLTTEDLTFAADFCGVRSGRDVDKFEYLHLTKLPSLKVGAPSIGESPVCLECVVKGIEKLGTHDLFIAEVVQVSVDERYLDEKGRFALEEAGLVAYVHGSYLSLGEKLGTFGFSVRKSGEGRQRKRSGHDASSADRRKIEAPGEKRAAAADRRTKEMPGEKRAAAADRRKKEESVSRRISAEGRKKEMPGEKRAPAEGRKKEESVSRRISAERRKKEMPEQRAAASTGRKKVLSVRAASAGRKKKH